MKRLFCPKAKNGLIKIGGVREIPGEKTVIVASLPRPCLTKTGGVCEIPGVKERARRIFFVAAESATCTHLARRKHRHHHWQLGLIELKYVFSAPSAPGCSPIPRDRATAPGPTHTAALAIPVERTGVAAKRDNFSKLLSGRRQVISTFSVGSTVERSILDKRSVS